MTETVVDPILAAAVDAEWAPPTTARTAAPNPFTALAGWMAENKGTAKALPLKLDATDPDERRKELSRTLGQLRRACHTAGISVLQYTTEPDKDGKLTLTVKGVDRIVKTPNERGAETPAETGGAPDGSDGGATPAQ